MSLPSRFSSVRSGALSGACKGKGRMWVSNSAWSSRLRCETYCMQDNFRPPVLIQQLQGLECALQLLCYEWNSNKPGTSMRQQGGQLKPLSTWTGPLWPKKSLTGGFITCHSTAVDQRDMKPRSARSPLTTTIMPCISYLPHPHNDPARCEYARMTQFLVTASFSRKALGLSIQHVAVNG